MPKREGSRLSSHFETGSKSQLYCFPAVWLWVPDFTSSSLSFLIYSMRLITPTSPFRVVVSKMLCVVSGKEVRVQEIVLPLSKEVIKISNNGPAREALTSFLWDQLGKKPGVKILSWIGWEVIEKYIKLGWLRILFSRNHSPVHGREWRGILVILCPPPWSFPGSSLLPSLPELNPVRSWSRKSVLPPPLLGHT